MNYDRVRSLLVPSRAFLARNFEFRLMVDQHGMFLRNTALLREVSNPTEPRNVFVEMQESPGKLSFSIRLVACPPLLIVN